MMIDAKDCDEPENDFAGSYLVWGWFLTWCEASDCNILAAAPSDSWVGVAKIPFFKIDHILYNLVSSTLSVEFSHFLKNLPFEQVPSGEP